MGKLRVVSESIVWQEVPNEVSLAFLISGCPLGCKGCHSKESWNSEKGLELSAEYLKTRLACYHGLITCVLFMGGEWQPEALAKLLLVVRQAGLKSCLYTGLEKEELPCALFPLLTYLKTGRWMMERGGLDSLTTNQRFIDLRTGEILNHLFIQERRAK